MITSKKQLEYLKNESLVALGRGHSTRNAYSALGIANWTNLPGCSEGDKCN